jgi:hypothetical protein
MKSTLTIAPGLEYRQDRFQKATAAILWFIVCNDLDQNLTSRWTFSMISRDGFEFLYSQGFTIDEISLAMDTLRYHFGTFLYVDGQYSLSPSDLGDPEDVDWFWVRDEKGFTPIWINTPNSLGDLARAAQKLESGGLVLKPEHLTPDELRKLDLPCGPVTNYLGNQAAIPRAWQEGVDPENPVAKDSGPEVDHRFLPDLPGGLA